ncbi:MAG: VOC family protein [Actinomycetota bacterium]
MTTSTDPPSAVPEGIENVALVHTDRQRALHAYERLGFTMTPQGRYLLGGAGGIELGLANHHALFRHGGYWEIITVGDGEKLDVGYGALLDRHGVHLAKVTLRLPDAPGEVERLREIGVEASGPVAMRRSLDVAGRTVDVDMELLSYPDHWDAWLHSSLIHADRSINYVPELLDHANGTEAIEGVIIATGDVDATCARLTDFSAAAPLWSDDSAVVRLPDGTRFEVWPTDAADERYPVRWSDQPESLRAVIFSVPSIEELRGFFDARGVAHGGTEVVEVDPSEAEGVHLVFEEPTRPPTPV